MSEQSEKQIKSALYTAVMQKLNGELSELEAKEVLLVNSPAYITSKDHDHADHIEELKNIIMKKVETRDALNDVKSLFSQSTVPHPETDGKKKKIVSGVIKFQAPHPDSGKTINRVRVLYIDGSMKEFDAIEWDMMVQEGRKLWIQHEKELSKNPERFDG